MESGNFVDYLAQKEGRMGVNLIDPKKQADVILRHFDVKMTSLMTWDC